MTKLIERTVASGQLVAADRVTEHIYYSQLTSRTRMSLPHSVSLAQLEIIPSSTSQENSPLQDSGFSKDSSSSNNKAENNHGDRAHSNHVTDIQESNVFVEIASESGFQTDDQLHTLLTMSLMTDRLDEAGNGGKCSNSYLNYLALDA